MPSTLGTPYSALRKVGVTSEDVICVFGLGALGLSAVQVAKVKGAKVFGVDIAQEKLVQAEKLGLDVAISAQDDLERKIKELCGHKSGIDIAFMAVGDKGVIETAMNCVRRGGVVVIVADPRQEVSFNPRSFISGITVTGSTLFRKEDILEMVRLVEEKRILLEPLIDGVYPLERINEAIAELDNNSASMNRLILVP